MTATATVYQINPKDYRKINVTMRDNRLADARRENAALRDEVHVLKMLVNGEIEGWGDFGRGEVYLIPEARRCDYCTEPFYYEEDFVLEPPAWMGREWLAKVSGLPEITALDGLVAEGGAYCCEGCAGGSF